MTTPRINMSPRGPPTAHTRAELRPHVRNSPTHPTIHSKMCVPYNCYLVVLRSCIGAKMVQIRYKSAKKCWLVYRRRHYISYNTTRPGRQSFVCDTQCRFIRSERPRWCSRHSHSLWAGRFGVQMPVGKRSPFLGVKRLQRGVDQPAPCSGEVQETVDLYFDTYSMPS